MATVISSYEQRIIRSIYKTNRIDQIIYESEKEMNEGAKSIDLDDAFKKLSKKYYEEI